MRIFRREKKADLRERLACEMLAGYLRLTGFSSIDEVFELTFENLEHREMPDIREMFAAWVNQHKPD